MSQDSGKGLRPRQYGGTNQLAEDRLERKAPMSRGLRQGGKQIISADSLLKKGEESLQRGPSSLAGRCMISAAGRSGQFAGVCGKGVCIYAAGVQSVWCNLCIYAEVVGVRCFFTGGGVPQKDSTEYTNSTQNCLGRVQFLGRESHIGVACNSRSRW